jgi:cytochrome P450
MTVQRMTADLIPGNVAVVHAMLETLPPGPRSRFPGEVMFAFARDRLGFLERTIAKYGDVVHFRIRRGKFFLFSHPDAIRDVLVTFDSNFTKGPALRAAKVTLGEGLLTSEGDFHKRQRRLSQPAFHPNRVSSYAGIFAQHAREQTEAWRDGGSVDMHEEMMRTTLRIVAKTLFDADVASEVEEIGRAMDVTVRMFTRTTMPFGNLLNRLPLPSNFRFYRAYGRLMVTIDRFIAERRASGIDHGDLLSMLMKARDTSDYVPGDDLVMSDKQLRDECMTLFSAGHETTANALTFTFHLLAHHPDIQKRLHKEVDDVLNGRLPTRDDTERLPFTRQVVAEAIRLYPPAWVIGRQAKESFRIANTTLPESAIVLICPWVVHRDPRWWKEPEQFNPDRWAEDIAAKRPRWSYFPFGGGSRSCIGESFAWMEAILVTATIASRWRVEPLSPRHPPLRPTITLRPKELLQVRVVKR